MQGVRCELVSDDSAGQFPVNQGKYREISRSAETKLCPEIRALSPLVSNRDFAYSRCGRVFVASSTNIEATRTTMSSSVV